MIHPDVTIDLEVAQDILVVAGDPLGNAAEKLMSQAAPTQCTQFAERLFSDILPNSYSPLAKVRLIANEGPAINIYLQAVDARKSRLPKA